MRVKGLGKERLWLDGEKAKLEFDSSLSVDVWLAGVILIEFNIN